MPDLSKRTFGRRAFVRLGVAAGGLGMLAACAPTPPPPPPATAPAKPTEAPKPAAGPTPAAAATQPAAKQQVTTLKLLGWYYEPPLVQENLDRFVQQNPNYRAAHSTSRRASHWPPVRPSRCTPALGATRQPICTGHAASIRPGRRSTS